MGSMETEEPIGPCLCHGKICNRGFGWIMGKIQDLAGDYHSGLHNVEVCDMFPQHLKEWDVEDGIFLPPTPPGIMSIDTMKGFMKIFRGTGRDLQGTKDSTIKRSMREGEKMGSDKWRSENV
jgi:hypothetical protein